MQAEAAALDRRIAALVDDGFAGVVRVDVDGEPLLRAAYGLADRARAIPMTVDTRLGTASGSKTLTALAVLSLVDDGTLSLSTAARSLLGADLPLIADDVTVEHLLCHRSGIGDYLDEEDDDYDDSDYLMPVPVHELDTTEAYLPILEGHRTKRPAGQAFSYCNGGYVVLALLAERASGTSFFDLVSERVTAPAGMDATAFLRSDALPGDAALGYVHVGGEWRSNVFHLPVRGSGDGGAFTTVDDVHRLWTALFEGRIVSPETVTDMVRARSDPDADGQTYGLGMWLDPADGDMHIRGGDAGVSFISVRDPGRGTLYTVLANAAGATWPVHRVIDAHLRGR